MNGKNQYGPARPVTFPATPARNRVRVADPARFKTTQGTSRSVLLLFGGSLLLGGFLAAVPQEIPGVAIATILGGAWLSLVLAVTLPSRAERAGAELSRRLGVFRHEVNMVGDRPTPESLALLMRRARELELRDDEIADELTRIRASLLALDLERRIERQDLPVVDTDEKLTTGDVCHLATPVRFGRRRSDQWGRLLLTSDWLKFRGALDVSVAWSEISDVQRTDCEVIVAMHESKRVLRFCCQSVGEAAEAGVLARHLSSAAQPRKAEQTGSGWQVTV